MFNSIDSSSRTMAHVHRPSSGRGDFRVLDHRGPDTGVAGDAAVLGLQEREAGCAAPHHAGRPAGAVCDRRGQQCSQGRAAARWRDATGTARLHGVAVLERARRSAPHSCRTEWRSLRRRDRPQPRASAPRRRRDRQGPGSGSVRGRAQSSVRHRLLPARSQPAIRLRRQHGFDRPLPLSVWRPEGTRVV